MTTQVLPQQPGEQRWRVTAGYLAPVPDLEVLHALDFLLQLKHTVQQGLSCGWAARDVDVYRDDTVTAAHHTVGVVVVATTVGAGAHGDDPARLRHLVIHLTQSRSHLVGEGACYDDDISLSRGGTKHHTKAIHIIAWSSKVHHLNSTASKTEGQRPEGALSSPIDKIIKSGHCIVHFIFLEGYLEGGVGLFLWGYISALRSVWYESSALCFRL